MAAGNTTNIRTHVMGDMLMVVGTFTDGGTDVYYGDTLREVFAAGGHVTSLYDTGVKINMGGNLAAGATAITVDSVDARLHWNIGETLYTDTGKRVGVITAIGSATSITVGGGVLTGGDMVDDENLHKLGPDQSAVTLNDGSLAVSVDETNKYVVFGNGNLGAASTAHIQDGRWWILGERA
jgi:hypothetical protein